MGATTRVCQSTPDLDATLKRQVNQDNPTIPRAFRNSLIHWFLAVWPLRKVSYHPTMSRNLLKSTTTHPHYTTFSNWWFPKNADGKPVSARQWFQRKSLQNSIKASGMIFSKPKTQPYCKQWTTHKRSVLYQETNQFKWSRCYLVRRFIYLILYA